MLSERTIRIDGKVAKKRSRRVVDVNDTLATWLAPHVSERGPVVHNPRLLYIRLRKISEASGVKWRNDALRHTIASQHLALHQDAVATAYQLGHRDPQVLHAHYKALVSKARAREFFVLTPDSG